MTSSAIQLSGLIGELYEAALDPILWRGLAPRLASAFQASSAVLKLQGAGGSELIDTTGNFDDQPIDCAFAEYWHRNDLWVERSAAHGFGRVVVGHELTPFVELEETGYYRDWLRPLSIRDMVGGVIHGGDGVGVIGIHRAQGEAAFGEAERAAMETLLPHLERAFRIRTRLRAAGSAFDLAALERSGMGILVVEESRRVSFLNAAAERMLSAEGLAVRAGRLAAANRGVQTQLDLALAMALANGRGRADRPPAPLALPRRDGPPLIFSAAPLPEQVVGRGIAILVLLREVRPERPSLALLRGAFDLTRTEAAVAAALCAGLNLDHIADELNVGIATVRSHLKSVLMKTQTRRQAELVALLSSLPAERLS